MKMLKLALVTETYPPEINGVAMTTGRLVAGLRARGHRVHVLRPRQHRGDDGGVEETVLSGLPVPGYPGLAFGLPARRRLRHAWREARPDLVHVVTEGPLGWSALAAARDLGIPVSTGYHTNFDQCSVHYGAAWLRPAVAAYLRRFHRRAGATIVPTGALAQRLTAEGVPGVRVVGRGVDTALFNPARRSPGLRRRLGITDDALLCLYVGRIAAEKNLETVLAAFAAIRAARPDARMLWVGDGPQRSRVEAEHCDHLFVGVQRGEALAECFASGDLLLFASLTETYGNVLAEAMASGVAVVAYRYAAAAEIVEHDASGCAVPPGDARAYVDAAVALALDDARRAEMGLRAQAGMAARDWGRVVLSFEEVVLDTIAGGRCSRVSPCRDPARDGCARTDPHVIARSLPSGTENLRVSRR